MPLSVLNGLFSGPRTACFGPRAFVLHRFFVHFWQVPLFYHQEDHWRLGGQQLSQQAVMLFRRPSTPVFLTSGLMLNTLGPFSASQNHIFVMYTHGRTLKTYGRPVTLIEPFEPLFELAYSLSCFRVVKFEPQGLVVHTWEDTIMWWPDRKSTRLNSSH